MKRGLPALCCAAAVLLTSCSALGRFTTIEYAPSYKAEIITPPGMVVLHEPGASSPSEAPMKSREPSLSTDEAVDLEDAILKANESLGGVETDLIADFSVETEEPPTPPENSGLASFEHYIEPLEDRYQAFIAAFPGLSESLSIALVNVNADFGYYNGITIINDPGALLVLCNKNFRLPEDYAPDNLRNVAGSDHLLKEEAASAFEKMKDALREQLDLPLVPISGYRSYSYQKSLYARYVKADGADVADTYSARAGHSEHQTGLTIDFAHKYPSSSLRKLNFQDTEQYEWLLLHAHEYGYILRYPEDYESITGYRFEPWHWRYIGAEDATRMYEANMKTFEEYMGTFYYGAQAAVIEMG